MRIRPQAAPFIVGAARSGTTLLRLMLDAHPELAIPPETNFIPKAIADVPEGCSEPAEAFCQAVTSTPRWSDFQLSHDELANRVKSLDPFDLGDAVRVFYELYADRFGKRCWGDKTPAYTRHMTTIQSLLPEARFVHLVRDGRDVACSIIPRSWGPTSVEAAAAWWRELIEAAREQAPSLTGYLEVRYEDLVQTPEPVLRRVCEFISISFDPLMLEYHATASERLAGEEHEVMDVGARGPLTADERSTMHRYARLPPQTDRIERWRSELGSKDLMVFDEIAGELLEDLGYGRPTSSAGSSARRSP